MANSVHPQFTKGTYTLRAVTLYRSPKDFTIIDGDKEVPVYKVGEFQPSRPDSISYGDRAWEPACEVEAIETFKPGGGWLVRFPNGELGFCDPNKIVGNESYKPQLRQGGPVARVGGGAVAQVPAKPAPKSPLEKVKAIRAELARIEEMKPRLQAELQAALLELQSARKEEEEILREAGLLEGAGKDDISMDDIENAG